MSQSRKEEQKKIKSMHKSASKNKVESPGKDKLKVLELKTLKSKGPKSKVRLGICAVKKKVQSKPMRQIIKRINCQEIEVIEMWEFLDKPIKVWPIVDSLICFYSEGFPYLKAWKYVRKNKPFLINNLEKQELLWDRSAVYDILTKIHIPVAKHYMIYRQMDYLDQIEAKAFGEDNNDEETRSEIRSDVRDDGLNSPVQSNTPFDELIYEQRRKSKIEDFEDNKRNSNSDNNGENNQRHFSEKSKRSAVRKSNTDLEACSLEKAEKSDKYETSIEKREPVTATIKRRDIVHEMMPYTLRKHHEDRMGKVEKYEIEEIEDYLLIKGEKGNVKLKKPFVEKPFDAENHNICIYYPESMGGGRKALFRKVKNSSSKYEENENCIRRDGNYIYEEYLPTNAFDIKVYTIGCFYMYAEARKSPTLDGVVERDALGKEKRYPIILTPEEKFMSKKIVQEFGQDVCGFDLLRANGKSYVCDVNGWSFVKGNSKYWDDCSYLLKCKIFARFMPGKLDEKDRFYERFSIDSQNLYRPPLKNLPTKKQELRSIVSIFRHGDRSPKLKLKFKTSEKRFIQLLIDKGKVDELKIKDVKGLTHLLEITNRMMEEVEDLKKQDLEKLGQMRMVLESGGHFEGLNRKCQMKVIKRDENGEIEKLQIVVKWGGELTKKGSEDAIDLGRRMRMQKYKDDQDFLSLHSSYRHDLKTYSSDEGRCIKTAASFLKGFLNIEGGLAPIITSMVMTHKKAQNLLDCTSEQNHSLLAEQTVHHLSQIMNSDEQLLTSYTKYVQYDQLSSEILKIMQEIGNPREKLKLIHKEIVKLVLILQNYELSKGPESDIVRNSGVSIEQRSSEDGSIIYRRWSKLQKDFYDEKQMKFNISKIPEIYDTIRHDLHRNSYIFKNLEDFDVEQFRLNSKLLAHFVVPNEYGLTDEDKIKTAQEIASPLLEKILTDLMFWKDMQYEDQYWKYKGTDDHWRHIRTRLYFTSASHIYSVMHLMTLGCNRQLLKGSTKKNIEQVRKLVYMSYLSHMEFRLYEDLGAEAEDPNRFRVQISLSPSYSKNHPITEASFGTTGFTIDEIQKFLASVVKKKDDLKDSRTLQKLQSKDEMSEVMSLMTD